MKSIGYIVILLFLVFYLYAVAGIYAFRANDPWHFSSLPIALLTLFRAATLEDWTDLMYFHQPRSTAAPAWRLLLPRSCEGRRF